MPLPIRARAPPSARLRWGRTGVVTFNASSLAAGQHYIFATYGGDANYLGSTSQSFPILVGDFTLKASPATASATAGQSTAAITLTYSGTTDFSKSLAGSPYASSGVTLACSGLPSGAGCDFTSTNIVPTANAGRHHDGNNYADHLHRGTDARNRDGAATGRRAARSLRGIARPGIAAGFPPAPVAGVRCWDSPFWPSQPD